MKSIAASAMAAIEAGEAIVTGAVEIIPLGLVNYTTIGVVDIDAVDNAAHTDLDGLTAGVEISGFDPDDIIRVSLPTGQTYTAWSPWGVPSPANAPGETGSKHFFRVIPGGEVDDAFTVGVLDTYDGYEAARAAFVSDTFSGASEYIFFIHDAPFGDNSGGLSILVERGVAVGSSDPIRVWGGYGPITIDGEVYQGIGERSLAQQTAGAIGGFAQGLTLTLSGVEPHLVELLDANEVKGASVVVRRLIFASDGKTLLDYEIFDRGRADTIETVETIGSEAAISFAIESAARGLGSRGARMRSDADQRLINPTDGYFKHTAFAGEKSLYWGGRKPNRAGSALGGSSISTSQFSSLMQQ